MRKLSIWRRRCAILAAAGSTTTRSPDLWVTPGVQMIWDPAFNPGTDFVSIFQIKMRLFL